MKTIAVPDEAHSWIVQRRKEIREAGIAERVTIGDVVLDVIQAIDDYDGEVKNEG